MGICGTKGMVEEGEKEENDEREEPLEEIRRYRSSYSGVWQRRVYALSSAVSPVPNRTTIM